MLTKRMWWVPVLLVIWAQIVQSAIASALSVHHYDFVYFHDFLARSVALTGQLDTPYLEDIGYSGWFLTVYGLTVLLDAAEHAIGLPPQFFWHLYSLALPSLVVWLVAQRGSIAGACLVALLLVGFFPATIIDIRPHWVVAFMLAAASIVVATSKAETRNGDVLLLSLLTVLAVLTKREAFLLFFVPCGAMLGLLQIGRRWIEIIKLIAFAGIPVIGILAYRVLYGASGGGFGVGDGNLGNSNGIESLVSLWLAISHNHGQMLVAALCGVAAIAFAGKNRGLIAWLFLGQIALFVAFDFVSQAGAYNESTILRKAYYPLAVALSLIGLISIPRLETIDRRKVMIASGLAVLAIVGIKMPGMIWHGNYNRERQTDFYRLIAAWEPITDKMEDFEHIFVSGENGFNFPLYLGNPYFPQGLAAAVFPREVHVVETSEPGQTVFVPGPETDRPVAQ